MAINIKSLNFEELVAAEKSANVVRKNYEDKMVMYRGIDYETYTEKERNEFSEFSQKLSLINSIRLRILDEMEKKLLNISYNEETL